MRRVTSLTVQSIRTHTHYTLDFMPSTTVIVGPNGSGKTSLIEALYVALRGVSFRGVDGDIIQHGAEWYRIDVTFDDGMTRTVTFQPERASGKKQFTIQGNKHLRLPAKEKLPVVLFEPDDLRLIHGSPARRRQFLDRFIAQINPTYARTLLRYERALKQRNAALKHPSVTRDTLFAWDVALNQYGDQLTKQRESVVAAIQKRLTPTYQAIAGSDDQLSIEYVGSVGVGGTLLKHLDSSFERDKVLGYTSVGPHRGDILFLLQGVPADTKASRGETRSIILALKLIEVEVITAVHGTSPIILLDDVFSELDTMRQKKLLEIQGDSQVVITSTEANVQASDTSLVVELD